jgi:hypothetical protein
MTKKRNKKYNPVKTAEYKRKMRDIIPPYEYETSVFNRYFKELRGYLTNGILFKQMLQYAIMLHRFTFMQGLEYENIRLIIDKWFKSLEHLTDDEINVNLLDKVKLHYKHVQLLLLFCDEVEAKIKSIRTRTEYTLLHKDMILNHNLFCSITAPYIWRWTDATELRESMETIQLKLSEVEIAKAKATGKKVLYVDHDVKIIGD